MVDFHEGTRERMRTAKLCIFAALLVCALVGQTSCTYDTLTANVTVYVAVHVVVAAGFSVACGHDTADKPGSGSVTPTLVNVTLPVFVTTYV